MHRMPGGIASGRVPREWLPALVLMLLLASTSAADVTIKENSVSEGLGGFGNGTTSRTLIVAGDRSRSEDEATYTGRFKAFAGGGKPRTTVAITRIDREVLWDLDPQKKTYTELTFAQLREQMEKGMVGAEETAGDAEPKDAEMTFTVDVKRTGAKQDVNGFAAEQVIVTCVGRPKAAARDAKGGEIRIVMDEWLAKNAPGGPEITAFYRRFAEKLGLDEQLSGISGMAQRMYGNAMKEMSARLRDVEGFPVRSTFTIEGSGEAAAAQKQAAEQGAAAAKAEREQAKAQAAADEQQQDRQDAADVGNAAVSGGGVTGKLGGLLGRKLAGAAQKKATEKTERATEEKTASGGGCLFKVVTEVTSISTSPAPAGSFEVPAGYKLQKKD